MLWHEVCGLEMDYFQSVVGERLQRDRAAFINTEFLLVHRDKQSSPSIPEWVVDIDHLYLRHKDYTYLRHTPRTLRSASPE